jgi:hypothetical protein
MDWIDLAQDRDQWNTVMNLRVPYNAGSSSVAAQLAASQEGLNSKSERIRISLPVMPFAYAFIH